MSHDPPVLEVVSSCETFHPPAKKGNQKLYTTPPVPDSVEALWIGVSSS